MSKKKNEKSTVQEFNPDGTPVVRLKSVKYDKWGYIFIAPFFLVYFFWSLIPQILTIFYSFFERYQTGLTIVGPTWNNFQNYITIFSPDNNGIIGILKYGGNTLIMWVLGAVPQFVIAMLLAVWFTSYRLNIKGQPFFKTVIYMPNLIMASAFSMLFFTLFSNVGPVNQFLQQYMDTSFDFFNSTISVRLLVAAMNFLMWFGNTTIVLMAGIMGIDNSLFEAAAIDGASSLKVFFKVTLPLLMPILNYAVITSMIGGINMYDVPYILTNRQGFPNRTSMTLIMYLQNYMVNKNYGMGGAISVVIFIFAGLLSLSVYRFLVNQYTDKIPGNSNKKRGGKR